MKKLNKQDYINMFILCFVFLVIVLTLTQFKYIYGSTTDWQQQHWLFPEYFRTLFYDTHDLFPDFAFNIGGGQNIFNFSYYGFLSPIVLFSYLLPFVEMMDYIIFTSIITVIASVLLLYKWLKNKGFDSGICFIVALIFLCSGPLIFQSHRHIMFINYFPFLIMGLMGVDRVYYNKKSLLLIVSTLLMILTSYYYSVSGIIVLFIYSLYCYNKSSAKIKLKAFIPPVLISIFLSGFFLLPTFMALLNGRSKTGSETSLLDISLFIPDLSIDNFFYNSYSLGFLALNIIGILWALFSKQRNRMFLSIIIIIIMVFPIFIYLMNGTLYIRGKVLIPFIPLISIITAEFLKDLFNKTKNLKWLIPPFAIILAIILFSNNAVFKIALVADSILTCMGILLFIKFKKKILVYIPIALISISCCFLLNFNDKLVLASDQEKINNGIDELVQDVINSDDSFYRISNEIAGINNVNKVFRADYYQGTLYSSIFNQNYKQLYTDVFNNELAFRNVINTAYTKNILFNLYMGNKYVITDSNPPIGYKLVFSSENGSAYKNENVFPLGYVTNQIMSEKDFNTLEYPYNAEALLKYCVVGENSTSLLESDIQEFPNSQFSLQDYKNMTLEQDASGKYFISAKNNALMNLKLNTPLDNQIIFLRFDMGLQSSLEDTFIIINGVKNKLTSKTGYYPNKNYTFDYVLSSDQTIESLKVEFNKGDYIISNIRLYIMDYTEIETISQTVDHFIVDTTKTKGDVITGTINNTKDGMFILNIPYDDGFTIKVNGESVDYQKVNGAFIGFDLSNGTKDITITYKAPYSNTGIVLSLLGIVFTVIYILIENKKRRV